jgi:hypothetical protein
MKQNWQDHPDQIIVECSLDGCSEQRKVAGAIQEGWAIHNGEWICSKHRAELDAPAEAIARVEEAKRQEAARIVRVKAEAAAKAAAEAAAFTATEGQE